jgi:hypothetical protein
LSRRGLQAVLLLLVGRLLLHGLRLVGLRLLLNRGSIRLLLTIQAWLLWILRLRLCRTDEGELHGGATVGLLLLLLLVRLWRLREETLLLGLLLLLLLLLRLLHLEL